MKIIFLTIMLFYLISCNEHEKTKDAFKTSKTWTVNLRNNLGILKIDLPNHLDTLFDWIQESDCGEPCEFYDYRIQPKTLPISKETGFIFIPLSDSVEQFTVKQTKLKNANLNSEIQTRKTFADIEFFKRLEAAENNLEEYFIDTTLMINGDYIYAYSYFGYNKETNRNIGKMEAIITVLGNPISLIFEYRKVGKKEANSIFFNKYFNAFKTLRISYGR